MNNGNNGNPSLDNRQPQDGAHRTLPVHLKHAQECFADDRSTSHGSATNGTPRTSLVLDRSISPASSNDTEVATLPGRLTGECCTHASAEAAEHPWADIHNTQRTQSENAISSGRSRGVRLCSCCHPSGTQLNFSDTLQAAEKPFRDAVAGSYWTWCPKSENWYHGDSPETAERWYPEKWLKTPGSHYGTVFSLGQDQTRDSMLLVQQSDDTLVSSHPVTAFNTTTPKTLSH